MQAHHYPFIDLAVHAAIRSRFANGDAVAVLSPDLEAVLWANGAAAELFGFETIYDILDEGLSSQPVIKRQIASALSGVERTGKAQNFMMRLGRGFSRTMTPASLESIILPDGATACMITSQAKSILAPAARARQIISGFEGTGTHVAVLDAMGIVLAASSTFNTIGLDGDAIERMIADVAGEDDRLVKRMVEASEGPMPAAIGRLTDSPLLHLLFAVEPSAYEDDTEDAADRIVPALSEPQDDDAFATESDGQSHLADAGESETTEAAGAEADNSDASAADEAESGFDAERVRIELDQHIQPAPEETRLPEPFAEARGITFSPGPEEPQEADQPLDEASPAVHGTDTAPELAGAESGGTADTDARSGAHEQATALPSPPEDPAKTPDKAGEAEFRFDPDAKPTRFVWKIDRDGAFSEVSAEFAAAVGPNAADIIGRRFPDIANVFNLDPDHVIIEALNRRDTWSGKTVFWPIQGTNLVTPVDLAALPTYTRDRHFDGFRGFGIVRSGETRTDPEAIGLALSPGAPVSTSPHQDTAAGTETEQDAAELLDIHGAGAKDIETEEDLADLARLDGSDPVTIGQAEGPDALDEPIPEAPIAENEIENPEGSQPPEDAGTGVADTDIDDDDPFRGEKPAIRLVETPMRRNSDKIIDLQTRRERSARESLSAGEQAAFREIGARLSETSGSTGTTDETEEPPRFGKRQPPLGADNETRDIEVSFDGEAKAADEATSGDETEFRHDEADFRDDAVAETEDRSEAADASDQTTAIDEASEETPATDDWSPEGSEAAGEPVVETPFPSAFALPPRQVMHAGLDASLIDIIPSPLLVHVGDELIHANTEFLELTGYTSLEALAQAGGLDHLIERSGGDDNLEDGSLTVRRGDGESRKVTARLRSVSWGEAHALLLALSPVTESPPEVNPAESAAPVAQLVATNDSAVDPVPAGSSDALAIEAEELRSILETATDGVVVLDNDGTIRSMNGSAFALFNYEERDTLQQPFAMLFAHESQRAVMDYISGLADHGVSSVLNDGREVIGREASGGFLPLFMTIGRLSRSNGYCAVLRDITQWKRTEEELRTAKRAAETANSHKSDFLAKVSHEIRTPLNAIIGFSEMMAEERFGPIGSPRYLEYAHDIGNSGKHVLDIVNDLLDISKIEAGQVDMEFTAVSLNDHLAESVSLLQPMANSQRVIIRTSLSESVPDVVADQRSVKQIALNLLSNAIRFTPSGGQIVVSTSYEPSGNVVIRIRDTGIGMSRKELEQAMKPFGQVGTGPRQRSEGTGLGLPLTKAMVEANRAQFDIVSAAGEGTLVSIAFPPQRVLAD
ncbi:ATP-binding protein [Hoeflea sp.]|uniref:ATP-binding protein n=1 Tax=Hoeflea sp. TaxID=1940281 RepID=UPI003749E743